MRAEYRYIVLGKERLVWQLDLEGYVDLPKCSIPFVGVFSRRIVRTSSTSESEGQAITALLLRN